MAAAKQTSEGSIAALAETARSQWSKGNVQQLQIELLGISPRNRGRLGVSTHHVLDVVGSIKDDGLSRQRYRDVCVVRVPDTELATFRAFNKELLEADSGLPPFSDKMRYACLTKRLGPMCTYMPWKYPMRHVDCLLGALSVVFLGLCVLPDQCLLSLCPWPDHLDMCVLVCDSILGTLVPMFRVLQDKQHASD